MGCSSELASRVTQPSIIPRSSRSAGLSRAIAMLLRPDQLRKPIEGRLGNTPLGRIIDVDDAKAVRKAGAPLEIVQKRPEKIATHIGAGSNSFLQRLGILGKIG